MIESSMREEWADHVQGATPVNVEGLEELLHPDNALMCEEEWHRLIAVLQHFAELLLV